MHLDARRTLGASRLSLRTCRCRTGIRLHRYFRRIRSIKKVKQPRKHHKDQQARFSSSRAARQPIRSMKSHVEQMPYRWFTVIAGIRFRKKNHVGVVRCGMKAHRKPKTPRAPQRKTPENAVQRNAYRIDPILVRLEQQMNQSKNRRQENRRGPEPDAFTQRHKRIATKHKFFPKY